MMLSTVSAISDILPALATVTTGATSTARHGRKLRLRRPEVTTRDMSPELLLALSALVELGYTVRVYALGSICTLGVDAEGSVTWGVVKASKRVRRSMTVEVVL